MYNFKFIIYLILLTFSLFPIYAYSSDKVLNEKTIKNFYKDLVEAKISGGEYLIYFHGKHYSDDLKMILNLRRKVGGDEMSRVFLDHDKESFMEAIKENSKILDHKNGRYDIVSISMNENDNSAEVHVRLVSQFIVQTDRLAPRKSAIEAMDCKDIITLSNYGVIQIKSSQCDVNVSMDK